MSDDTWIDLRAHGKMFGQLSHDGRRLVFRRRGMVVEFDLRETVRQGRATRTDFLTPIENASQF